MSKLHLRIPIDAIESRTIMANLDAAVALTLLEGLEKNLQLRRERANLYFELLAANDRIQLIPHNCGSAYLSQVAILKTSQEIEFRRILNRVKESGFEINRSYTPLHLQPKFEHFESHELKMTEEIWPFLFELPCEPGVSIQDIRDLCTKLLEIVSK